MRLSNQTLFQILNGKCSNISNPNVNKDKIIARLLEDGTPLPTGLLPMLYKYTVDQVLYLTLNLSRKEVYRLKIYTGKEHYRNLKSMHLLLIQFIQINGVGMQLNRRSGITVEDKQFELRLRAAPSGLKVPTFNL